ncbi:MAG: AAA family ATPase [Turicibacter sp.]|nr:AAA family ATPase [Turicibacter sp.]
MYIKKFLIENFKSLEKVTINLNNDLNIFTGSNNVGKTTVLESVALWAECFNLLIKQSQKAIKNINIDKGDYKLGDSNPSLINYNEIISVRSPNFQDLFYNLDTNKKILLRATIQSNNNHLIIGFIIQKSNGGTNYRIALENYKDFDFKLFNTFFLKFPNPIDVIYASPVNNLIPYEEFETIPKIKKRIKCRESISILRNRLYQLKKDSIKFSSFIDDLSYILYNKQDKISFNFIGDETKEPTLIVTIRLGGRDIEKDISLVGSGTIQIIELLLSLYEEDSELQIVLLDEPDSHIHRDIQKRLINILNNHANKSQIFLTTHNESLIRSSKPEHLFYLEKDINKVYSPIINDSSMSKKIGLQPSKHIKILANLGSESGLDIINALEADKLLLVEGPTDAKYIQTILDKNDIHKKNNIMYWSFDGIDNLLPKLTAYKDFFSLIKNGKSLWDKSILVLDSDYTTDKQRNRIIEKIQEKFNIKTYMWNCYTLESTILIDSAAFKEEVILLLKQKSSLETINSDDVSHFIDTLFERLINQWEERYSLTSEKKEWLSITHTISNRKKNIQTILGDSKIYNRDEQQLLSDFIQYASSQISNGNVSIISTKKDVKNMLTEIYDKYEITKDETLDPFEFFINQLTRGEWIKEWDNLIELIYS